MFYLSLDLSLSRSFSTRGQNIAGNHRFVSWSIKTEKGDNLIKSNTLYIQQSDNENQLKTETIYVLESKDNNTRIKTESGDDVFIKIELIFVREILDSNYVYVKNDDVYVRKLETDNARIKTI